MTKTRLLGGIFTLMLLTTACVGSSETVYAKSTPTATGQVVYASMEHRNSLAPANKEKIGFMPSLYRGEWYSNRWERVRECIMYRESRHNYRAANKTSSARGAYQFLDNSWRTPLTYMMIAESKKTKDGLRQEIKSLREKPIHEWSRYYQDRAFFTAWRHGEGKKHWFLQGSRCFSLM
jgi:hypothetical protein